MKFQCVRTLGYVYTTPSFGSGSLQDLIYHYDQVGNVTAIVDNIFTGSRIFTYDALNRLETAYGYFGTDQAIKDCSYTYNSIGNITNKCGVTFTYGDPLHPSAVTQISTGKSYSYDDNGNMLTGGGRNFDWSVDNRVTSVSMGGTTTMEYDYTGMRVKKNGAGTTRYPFQGVEIAPNGEVTKFIRIGTENFALRGGKIVFAEGVLEGDREAVIKLFGHEFDHIALERAWPNYSSAYQSFNDRFRYFGNPLEWIAEHRGSVFASEVMGYPVPMNPFYTHP